MKKAAVAFLCAGMLFLAVYLAVVFYSSRDQSAWIMILLILSLALNVTALDLFLCLRARTKRRNPDD